MLGDPKRQPLDEKKQSFALKTLTRALADTAQVNMVLEIPKDTNEKYETVIDAGPVHYIQHEEKMVSCEPWGMATCCITMGPFPKRTRTRLSFAPPRATLAMATQWTLLILVMVVESRPRGSVYSVRVLGALALIDENETDWKVIAVDVTYVHGHSW